MNTEEYDPILSKVPFEILKEWCVLNLSSEQLKAISGKKRKNYKTKKVYLFDLNKEIIGEYNSIVELAKKK